MSVAHILVVDDEKDIRTLIEEILADEGYRVTSAGDAGEARRQVSSQSPDLVLLDIWMPDTDGITLLKEWSASAQFDCPVVIMSGHGTVETAVEATRLGAADFIEKPVSIAKLLRTVGNVLKNRRKGTGREGHTLLPSMLAPIGKSRQIAALKTQAEQAASDDAPLLVVGEPGTGRQAIARYMCSISDRGGQPFVVMVSASITDDNAATLLLGAETAAGLETGYLEQANGGTLFIEELQDLCPDAQRLLFGVLDQGEFSRVGRAVATPVNIRVMTSIRPETLADPASFDIRPDLISTLSRLILRVPPLRDYSEDVPELLRYFVDRLVDYKGLPFRRFGVAAQNRLRNYPWPGNIHELESLVQRLLTAEGPEEIGLDEIEQELTLPTPSDSSLIKKDLLAMPLREAREHFERAYLTEQLALCGGKVGKLAKRVGMERTHLYRKLRTLGVNYRHLSSEE
jgi:two-component system nitrogen regulation response regulator NtrX